MSIGIHQCIDWLGNDREEFSLKDLYFTVKHDLIFKLLAQPISPIMLSARFSDDSSENRADNIIGMMV
jgi:hypothetical protein